MDGGFEFVKRLIEQLHAVLEGIPLLRVQVLMGEVVGDGEPGSGDVAESSIDGEVEDVEEGGGGGGVGNGGEGGAAEGGVESL